MQNFKKRLYLGSTNSVGCSIFSGPGYKGRPSIIGQIFPYFSDLLHSFWPGRELCLQVWMVDVGIQDHGNCRVVTLLKIHTEE